MSEHHCVNCIDQDQNLGSRNYINFIKKVTQNHYIKCILCRQMSRNSIFKITTKRAYFITFMSKIQIFK